MEVTEKPTRHHKHHSKLRVNKSTIVESKGPRNWNVSTPTVEHENQASATRGPQQWKLGSHQWNVRTITMEREGTEAFVKKTESWEP